MSTMRENTGKTGIARCRDRTCDIRLVRAVDPSEINNLRSGNRTQSGHSGPPPRTSGGTRRAYHKSYYALTAERRRLLAHTRRQCIRWTRWLLANLEWPTEPASIVPRTHPIRRPLLRLPRRP